MKLAEALQAETAAVGLAEAEVLDAKAGAERNYGTAEADVIAAKGEAEAKAMGQKYSAEADGVAAKADAMKQLDGVGKEHEEFKLQLNKELEVELKEIDIQKDIAAEQAKVLGEALKSANIDIVGGDGEFFDSIINSITRGKQVDRVVGNSDNLQIIRDTFFSSDGSEFGERIKGFMDQFGVSSDDVKKRLAVVPKRNDSAAKRKSVVAPKRSAAAARKKPA